MKHVFRNILLHFFRANFFTSVTVFESTMDEFIGKDEAFVEQRLVRQGLDGETYRCF